MDYEKRRKLQKVSVVIAEAFMVVAVLGIVTVTVLATMGFNFNNQKGTVEQSGLMQLHTMPTGASISIDGESLFARTNTSHSLSPGEHWLELSRDGYDTWNKAIKMQPGHLMRLYYPRLFLQNRTTEEVSAVKLQDAVFYQISKGRNYALYGNKNGQWQLADIKGDTITTTTIDVKEIFVDDTNAEAEIIPDRVDWSKDENRVLVHAKVNGVSTWAVVNFKEKDKSVNITKKFNRDFTDIKLASNSALRLWAFENGNIHIVDAGSGTMSGVLLSNVSDFAVYDEDLAYVTKERSNGKRAIGYYQDGAKAGLILKEVEDTTQPVRLAVSHYYDENYLAYTIGQHLWVWGGQFSGLVGKISDKSDKESEFNIESSNSPMTKFTDTDISVLPGSFVVNNGGEFVLGNNGNQFLAIDLDSGEKYEYERNTDKIRWIDDDMMYGIVDGKLSVWDFDGWNTRELASDVSDYAATISKNDRYLYYVSNGKMMRMKILD